MVFCASWPGIMLDVFGKQLAPGRGLALLPAS